MNVKKYLAALMAAAMLTAAGCGSAAQKNNAQGGIPYMNNQLTEGSVTAVIETSMGSITVMLFPEQAPKAVENFITHAKEGYYDGLIFHRVIQDFMIQGGDPNGTGTGGESIWGESFEDEFSDSLHNFRGALCMANSGIDTNGSQFFIVQASDPLSDGIQESVMMQWYYNILEREFRLAEASGMGTEALQQLLSDVNARLSDAQKNGIPEEYRARFEPAFEKYKEVGGAWHLDYKHTVFGQVTAGMDVVDAIAAVETGANDKPVTDVVIQSITLQD